MNKIQHTMNNSQTNNSQSSYANKLKTKSIKNIQTPKRDQAIIMTAHDDIPLREYVTKLCEIIKPEQITAASRIGHGRICIYLDHKDTANNLVNNYKYMEIQQKQIELRHYAIPTRKIIISRADICIPNEPIEEKLIELGLKPASPIIYLRIGAPEDKFKHILSFRRQVYIIKEDNQHIPDYITINYENEEYKIFLQDDNLKCQFCMRSGHTETNCYKKPTQQEQTQERHTEIHTVQIHHTPEIRESRIEKSQKQNQQPPSTNKKTDTLEKDWDAIEIDEQIDDTFNIPNPTHNKRTKLQSTSSEEDKNTDLTEKRKREHKRSKSQNTKTPNITPPPSTAPSEENFLPIPSEEGPPIVPTRSRDSISSQSDTEEQLIEIETEMEKHPNKYALKYHQLKDFMENSIGHSDKISLAKEYTKDIQHLIRTLKDLYQLAPTKTKNRLTRIIKSLEKK